MGLTSMERRAGSRCGIVQIPRSVWELMEDGTPGLNFTITMARIPGLCGTMRGTPTTRSCDELSLFTIATQFALMMDRAFWQSARLYRSIGNLAVAPSRQCT